MSPKMSDHGISGGDPVENVSMQHQVFSTVGEQGVIFLDPESVKMDGHEFAEHVIVVAPKIDDLGFFLINLFEDQADKTAAVLVPGSSAAVEAPGVDYVAIENKGAALRVLKESVYLLDLTVPHTQVHI